LLERGEVVTLKTWISAIPTTIIRARPRLALFYAWSQLGTAKHDATLSWLRNWMVHIEALGYVAQGELAMARETLAAELLSSFIMIIHSMLGRRRLL
jgi:ATP/maltotriose-dependent transcriptional regulator MalT